MIDSFQVNRGGSWSYNAQYARVAYRHGGGPGYRYDLLGFRLSREITVLQRLAEGEKDEKVEKENKYQ
mgnify:CR=1 FL=1